MGRMGGAAAFARLQSNEEFVVAMAAARADIEAARDTGLKPTVDCEEEARALETPMP